MLQERSVPFHLIYSAEDLCQEKGCKWCACMKPWFGRDRKKTIVITTNRSKLDVHAPEFVPAARRVAHLTSEIYATAKPSNFVSKTQEDLARSSFKYRYISALKSSRNEELRELLDRHLSNIHRTNKDVLGIGNERPKLEPLRREESLAAIDAKAWELATETFNESLLECIPRMIQQSGQVLANDVVRRIDGCEEVMMRMGQEAMDKFTCFSQSGHDRPQVDLLLDMRLDTIATILKMNKEEVKAINAANARARAEEGALRAEIEHTHRLFNALEDQLQTLHTEAARLRGETAEMRAAIF